MSKIDPEQERARLAARYSEMSDLELRKVGRDPSALTGWARTALGNELKRRGLAWQPALPAAKPIDEQDILIRLGVYADRSTAGLVRDLLAEKGIKGFFYEDEPYGSEQPGEAEETGNTRLLVRARDLAMARLLIAEKEKAELELQKAGADVSKGDRPVVLRRYRDMPQAVVEKSVLEDAGISCFLQDDNVIRMDWLWSNAMGGIKLLVRERDATEAERILSQAQAGPAEHEGEQSS
jgi:hypothetical protein